MANEIRDYMSESLIDANITWLEDCIEYGTCDKCLRKKEGLCGNAKSPIKSAVETMYYLREELARVTGQKVPKRHIRAQEETGEESKAVKAEVNAEPKKRGRKPKNG